MKNIIIYIVLYCFSGLTFAQEQEEVLLDIKIIQPIVINQTKEIAGQFDDIKPEAINTDIDEMLLKGKVSYTPKDKLTQVRIDWQAITKKESSSQSFSPLANSYSILLTDDKRIEALTNITMKTDEKSLMFSVNKMQQNEKIAPVALDEETIAQLKDDTKKSSTTNDDSSAYTVVPEAQLNATQKDTSTTQITTACAVQYDINNLVAFKQQKIDTVDSNGKTVSAGTCLNTGEVFTLTKSYGTPCRVVSDPVQNIVYQAYRITGVIDNVDTVVRECQVDYVDNTLTVLTTTDSCSYQHNLDTGISLQTSKKYYVLNGEIVQLSNCAINGTSFTHQKVVCEYNLSTNNDHVIPQVKTVITLTDGSLGLVQDCTTDSTQIPVILKECLGSQRYAHDFSADISYLNQEKWVLNPYDNNAEVKVNNCQISATSYPHHETTNGCVPIFEDHNLVTNQTYKTYITDGTQTIILDALCSDGTRVPYTPATISLSNNGDTKTKQYIRLDSTVYSRSETTQSAVFSEVGNYTWTVPTGINQVYAIVVSGQGGQGGAGGPGFVCSNGVNGSNGSNSSFDSLIAVGGSGGSGGQATSYGCDITVNGSYGQSNQTNGHIDVITGTSINVIVGIGGAGGTSQGFTGATGATGSVIIKY